MLKRVSHLPGFLALASDVVEEKKCFSELVPLQREGRGACETVFRKGQGRGKKLVTEEPKPVGSGEPICRICNNTTICKRRSDAIQAAILGLFVPGGVVRDVQSRRLTSWFSLQH